LVHRTAPGKQPCGDWRLVRFIGTNSGFIRPMHIRGGSFKVVTISGNPMPEGDHQ
jgi:hypothetical protein